MSHSPRPQFVRADQNREHKDESAYKRNRFHSRSVSPRPFASDSKPPSTRAYPNFNNRNPKHSEWESKNAFKNQYPEGWGNDSPISFGDSDWGVSFESSKKVPRNFSNNDHPRWEKNNRHEINFRGDKKDRENDLKKQGEVYRGNKRPSEEKKLVYQKMNFCENRFGKRVRTEFPEQLIYEYTFLASPEREMSDEIVHKLLDPSMTKENMGETLASIASKT